MRRLLVLLFVSIAGIGPAFVFAQNQNATSNTVDKQSTVYDVSAFTAELQRISDALEEEPSSKALAVLRDSLPKQWLVKTPNGTFSISTEPLDKELAAGASGVAEDWVDHLLSEVQSYSAPSTAKTENARGELNQILSGSEFAAVGPPGVLELFRQRVAAWIGRILYKIFGGLERYPIGGQILFWSIVVACVGFIALWLFRFMVSRDRMESLPPGEIVSATRTWQEWIREAREAAGRNDYREAVHSAYWAGIARLEDRGVVPKDRTKTPREYLRLVSEPSPHQLAPRPIFREPLSELTKRLERIWYANRGAGPEDFRESLRQLEALGCQLE
jgi:hypothetical protein